MVTYTIKVQISDETDLLCNEQLLRLYEVDFALFLQQEIQSNITYETGFPVERVLVTRTQDASGTGA
jgi:hypothetical protein